MGGIQLSPFFSSDASVFSVLSRMSSHFLARVSLVPYGTAGFASLLTVGEGRCTWCSSLDAHLYPTRASLFAHISLTFHYISKPKRIVREEREWNEGALYTKGAGLEKKKEEKHTATCVPAITSSLQRFGL